MSQAKLPATGGVSRSSFCRGTATLLNSAAVSPLRLAESAVWADTLSTRRMFIDRRAMHYRRCAARDRGGAKMADDGWSSHFATKQAIRSELPPMDRNTRFEMFCIANLKMTSTSYSEEVARSSRFNTLMNPNQRRVCYAVLNEHNDDGKYIRRAHDVPHHPRNMSAPLSSGADPSAVPSKLL